MLFCTDRRMFPLSFLPQMDSKLREDRDGLYVTGGSESSTYRHGDDWRNVFLVSGTPTSHHETASCWETRQPSLLRAVALAIISECILSF